MSERFEKVIVHCLTAKSERAALPARSSGDPLWLDRAWRWVLRLVLPLLAALTGLVVYWLWFDHMAGERHWLEIVGGVPLAAEALLVLLWAVGSWYFKDMT